MEAAFLRVIKGDASPEEVAALVAVLTAAAAPAPADPARGPRPGWNDPSTRLRRPFPHGPDAWRLNARRGIL